MSEFNSENFNDGKDTSSSEDVEYKKFRRRRDILKLFLDIEFLKNKTFTPALHLLFFLIKFLTFSIVIYLVLYLIFTIFGCENYLHQMSPVIKIIKDVFISFGGWFATSILAIKQSNNGK